MIDIGGYIAAILIMLTWTFVAKETPLFRIAERTVLGLSIAYSMIMGVKSIQSAGLTPIANGHYQLIIPMLLGILLLLRFWPKTAYLSRFAVAWVVGVGVGVVLSGLTRAQFLQQIAASIVVPNTFDNIIIIVFTLCVPLYFFFSRVPATAEKVLRPLSVIGRYALMIGFGATFGNAVMYRITLAVGNLLSILRTLIP